MLLDLLAVVATLLAGAVALVLVARRLALRRPGFPALRFALAAVAVRVIASGAIALTGIERTLRGPDELLFLEKAEELSDEPLSSGRWVDTIASDLHELVVALQFAVFGDPPDLSLRATQAVLATIGLLLLAAVIYDRAGGSAARVGMVLLALEPTSVFFTTLIHKESLMLLAAGMVTYGASQLWDRWRWWAVATGVAGLGVALATRPYAAAFLAAATGCIVVHGSLRRWTRLGPRATALVTAVVILGGAAGGATLAARSGQLDRLQLSQDANVSDASNLKLEPVDFSTPGALVVNLPIRVFDVLLRPYPWQLGSASQRVGLVGTLMVLAVWWCVGLGLWRRRGHIVARAGPLLYIAALMLIGYALSAGNAGTAYRYRMHVVQVAACIAMITLRPQGLPLQSQVMAAAARVRGRPVPAAR